MGYSRAGFDVVGVDIKPQPHYPFEFHQADALTYWPVSVLTGERLEFDAIHASPPCQAYSHTQRLHGKDHPALIEPTRRVLAATGLPYAIENVEGAPLNDPVMLCGSMFGLEVKRHRLFEATFPMLAPQCQHHTWRNKYPTHARKDKAQFSPVVHVYGTGGGSGKDIDLWRRAMDVPWMQTKSEISEAIPPAYAEFIGRHLLDHLELFCHRHNNERVGER